MSHGNMSSLNNDFDKDDGYDAYWVFGMERDENPFPCGRSKWREWDHQWEAAWIDKNEK